MNQKDCEVLLGVSRGLRKRLMACGETDLPVPKMEGWKAMVRLAQGFERRLREYGENPLQGLSADELIVLGGRTNLLRGRPFSLRR